jgi:hypothetical protein
MKKATVQITYDAEKLGAIRQYMGKKDAELQTEMEDFLQKLYEKHVPAPAHTAPQRGSGNGFHRGQILPLGVGFGVTEGKTTGKSA